MEEVPNPFRVGLSFSLSNTRHRVVFLRLAQLVQDEPGMSLHTGQNGLLLHRREIPEFGEPEAFVTPIYCQDDADALAQLRCKIIAHVDLAQTGQFCRVLHDNEKIGQLAAEHFLERGFHKLAFVGPKAMSSTHERAIGFENHLREVGHAPEALEYVHDEEITDFCRRFQGGEVPPAVFCADDQITWQVLAVMRKLGLRLPEDAALMGVGPDELAQAVSPISISSVLMDNQGQASAIFQLLRKACKGALGEREEVRVAPTGIFEGESTGYFSPSDPLVAKALERIRSDDAPRDAAQLARSLNVSRRVLERHFQEAIGRSPAQELRRARIELAQRLLRTTDLSIDLISERCGYEHARHFTEMFRKMTGETPAKYRREMKL